MAKRKGKIVISVIVGIVLILLLAMGIGIIYRFTNGFNEDFKTFYIEHGGEKILTGETEATLYRGREYSYEVKYTFDGNRSDPRGYSVKVVANEKISLSFTTDGRRYHYADAKELTGAFEIRKEASAFTLVVPEKLTLKDVLEKVYGKTVEVDEPQGYLYTLVVSSYNEQVTYRIRFGISTKLDGMKLDTDGLVFGGGIDYEKH